MNCLKLCLRNITGKRKRKYTHSTKRKKEIKENGLLYGWDVIYKTGQRPTGIKYIEIYNTGRGTTHAVVQKDNIILYNPYKVKDLLGTNGYIYLNKI